MNLTGGATADPQVCDHSHLEREIETLSQEILDRYEEVNILYRLSGVFADMFREDGILDRLLSEAGRAVRGGWGWIAVIDDAGAFAGPGWSAESAASMGRGEIERLALRAIEEGRVVPLDPAAAQDPGCAPAVAVPLPGKNGPIGAMVIGRDSIAGAFRSGEQQLLATIASYGASVVENRRLVQAMKSAERVNGEIEIARQVQVGLLPSADPVVEGLQVSGLCRPAHDIGGDYFGYTHVRRGRIGLMVADVSGHSIGAAIGMVMTRCLLQSEAHRSSSPSTILGRVNELLCRDLGDPGMFVTAFVAVYQEKTGVIRYTNAGHNPPLIHRAATGGAETLSGGGPGLGIIPEATFQECSAKLRSGDILVMYTDGVTEARSPSGRMFELDRLKETVKACCEGTAREIVREIEHRVALWTGGRPLADDLTLVVAKQE